MFAAWRCNRDSKQAPVNSFLPYLSILGSLSAAISTWLVMCLSGRLYCPVSR